MKEKIRLLGTESLYILSVLIVAMIANPVQFLGKKVIQTGAGAVAAGACDLLHDLRCDIFSECADMGICDVPDNDIRGTDPADIR